MPTARPCHRSLPRAAILALATFATLACSGTTDPTRIGGVDAVSRDGNLEVTNRTDAPVFTFIIGRETSALADWVPCVDAARCPPIPPGESRRQANSRKIDGSREKEAVVSWWHAVATPNGLHPDSIRSAVVPLHW